MSVANCAKRGCGTICCTMYSPAYGYICYGCKEDLESAGPCDPGVWLDKPKHIDSDSVAWRSFLSEEFILVRGVQECL